MGRIGGDEFLALLPGISRENLTSSVEALKTAVAENPVELADDNHTRPMISIGAALFPYDSQDPDELIMLSDKRMYEDKERFREQASGAAAAQPRDAAAKVSSSTAGV